MWSMPISYANLYGISKEDVQWYLQATSDFILREGDPVEMRVSADPEDKRTITLHGNNTQYTDSSFCVYGLTEDQARTFSLLVDKRARMKGFDGGGFGDLWTGSVLPCRALAESTSDSETQPT